MSEKYDEYLASDDWRIRRRYALERDGHRCRVCNSTDHLHVHHRTYASKYDEKLDDLTTLCAKCHALYHEAVKASKKPRKRKGLYPHEKRARKRARGR